MDLLHTVMVLLVVYLMADYLGALQVGCIVNLRLIRRVEMPRATVVLTPVRKPLETVEAVDGEEAAFVELRRLSFGEKLRKDAEGMKMRFAADEAKGGDMQAEIAMINESVTLREFALCVTDHNLTDEHGNKLDFKKADDVRKLDPRTGQEIQELIGDMNDYERKAKESAKNAEGK